VVVGVDGVRTGLQADRFAAVVVASDASPRAEDRVVRLAQARGVVLVTGPTAELIGNRLGRPPVMAVGVVDRALARGLAEAAPGKAHTED